MNRMMMVCLVNDLCGCDDDGDGGDYGDHGSLGVVFS